MRNLRNIGQSVFRRPYPSAPSSAACWDVARDEVIVACGPRAEDARIELLRVAKEGDNSAFSLSEPIASWDVPPSEDANHHATIRSMHHFSDTQTTCVIMSNGDIITVIEDDDNQDFEAKGQAHVEIVGTLTPSITAARWSPDEELLVLATGDAKLVFMSRTFDVITETPLTPDDLRLSKHVSVGWGKKETQFHGRGAKATARAATAAAGAAATKGGNILRDPTIPETVDEGVRSERDDGRCSISWRGDGAYVAVNYLQPGVRRVVRVYNRDGELDSVSEPVDGLEGALSWRPEGNLIAGVQRVKGSESERVDVVFFERNGLRHGQFTLRVPVGDGAADALDEVDLQWNADSTVLAVVLQDRVQLWTMGNYHWYLKRDIPCSRYQPHRPLFSWHAEKPLRFLTTDSYQLFMHEYAFTISRGPTHAPYDHGAVAVIDGHTLKFTPFRTCNPPPPMAMCELELPAPAIDVAFTPDGEAMAVLHGDGVSYFALEAKGSRLRVPRLVEVVDFGIGATGSEYDPASLLQIAFSREREARVLHMTVSGLELLQSDFSDHPENEPKAWNWSNPRSAVTITSSDSVEAPDAIIQHSSGQLSRSSGWTSGWEIVPLSVQFPTLLPWISVVVHDGETLAFGLSRNGQLYANGRLLAKNCSSFLVTDSHLVFTTANHLVKFVHLASEKDLDVPPDDPENDERCRSIERGGRLVTAIPTKMALVLQMPRGNLETIYPRAMVLAGIRRLVEQKEYGVAFATCRTQRVDMNILFDHRPEQFLEGVGGFLEQVGDPANVDLFLSSLRDEDVTQTMYRDTKTGQPVDLESKPSKPGKTNTVCDAVLQTLQKQKKANLQNIITAHVCKVPPALDDGLLVVAELMQEDDAAAERAVEHICFLADVNQLYDHALGLYNLDLTLLVAQQSQRDPREYLPFVQQLHKMPELNRKFTIDDKLERWEKALDHLHALHSQGGPFADVEQYLIKHPSLYPYALDLYRHQTSFYQDITALFANHLKATSRFQEAGLAFESLGRYADATDSYLKVGVTSWRECLFTAQQQPDFTPSQLTTLATSLADALLEAKDHASAATIHLDYLASVDSAVTLLCRGYLFSDALRLVALHRRPDLLPTAIDTGLADAFATTTEFLADCRAQLQAQVPRIAELRRKAREDPLAFYEGENPFGARTTAQDADGMIPDDISIAASSGINTSASLFTRYTGKGAGSVGTVGTGVSRATSKNRRREEKKRARGRKGTVYEEEYLVNSVRRLVERVAGTVSGTQRLIWGLTRRGMGERARAVEELVAGVLDGCRKAVEEVWPSSTHPTVTPTTNAGNGTGQGGETEERDPAVEGYRPGGGDGVLFDSLEAMRAAQTPPVVPGFGRLVLLGRGRT
ncbi:IKI3 family-domain-containing protein [Dichotomopilus funicola]|uniref:Elongator complex protein 1 n=1 Tax=Dichotomopilus funicola TaxID=1934379 RepID=A0AAN6ZRH3_9PEZI|nr:IKI3 family-domain-containing protein [Dichotomopilus funicola]